MLKVIIVLSLLCLYGFIFSSISLYQTLRDGNTVIGRFGWYKTIYKNKQPFTYWFCIAINVIYAIFMFIPLIVIFFIIFKNIYAL